MTDDENRLTRRATLRAAGATIAAGALAGCGGRDPEPTTRGRTPGGTPTTDATTPPGTESTTTGSESATLSANDLVDPADYGTVVNVAEAGADTAGEEPINPVVEEHVGDDTLLYFPAGRYLLDDWRVTDYSNLAVVGDGATLVAPPDVNYWLKWGDLDDLLFAGFTVDCRGKGVAPIARIGVAGGDSVVRDVAVRGHRTAPRTAFEVEVTDPDGTLLFDRLSLPDGSTTAHAVYVFPESVGELTFRDCRVEHWKEGLYAAYHRGPLRVEGGYYANNGIEQVRVGGGTAGAVVSGVTVRVDNPRQPQNKPNMRGVWAEEGAHVRIENCDIAITDLTGTYSSGGIVVGRQFGEAVVENTRVRTDVGTNALSVREPIESMQGQTIPSMDSLPERTRFTARNVRIEGTAETDTAVRVHGRDDATFERLCVQQPKGDRDGLLVEEADGCSVSDSTIDVSGEAVVTEEATVATEQFRRNGSC